MPHVVDIIKRPRPIFKKHPYKSMEDDPNGVISLVPYGVLHVGDIRAYIHSNLEELSDIVIVEQYKKLFVDSMLKDEYKVLAEKKFSQFMDFPRFDVPKWIRYVLSRIHDQFMRLDKPYKITKEVLDAIIGFVLPVRYLP